MNLEQSVTKRWHIKFRRRGITQKKAYNNQGVFRLDPQSSVQVLSGSQITCTNLLFD